MKKTFWAIDITLYQVTADVNHHNVSIDGGASSTREPVLSHYVGSFTEVAAREAYVALDTTLKGRAVTAVKS